MNTNEKHLYDLDELSDYKISEGYADIRGWDVKDIDNRVIGKVDNLLVNKEAQRVVYIDVEVDKSIIDASHDPYSTDSNREVREFINKDGENHIIIPIGLLDINSDLKHVYTHTVNYRTFSETKRYRKGDNVDRAYEVQVLDSYKRDIALQNLQDAVKTERTETFEEERIRELVRDEIRKFHNIGTSYFSKVETDETDLPSKTHKNNPYDEENFYNRHEFENNPFKSNQGSRR
ncbi:PRC-barrel-like protein [Formosa agariphila KMM 3901]|uniref:PRC-barrel-like protein n=1 Tax=Formosa agariphila (strain DSM 15362 / KCTC 12365 / LMG 23005 / KMM 3901 / M-2Alg 35-1) TaxID=1347342 RepID=T2KJM2_FORAG|nr:PRC-barrel domain-containing protein [Formosa agariphila]CDF78628.1 PRC-barrel-like protein [Formosa agariphila KMM 3901]